MIKLDIDMPTECRLCPIYNGEFGECQLRQQFPSRFNDVHALFDKRPHNCPLYCAKCIEEEEADNDKV